MTVPFDTLRCAKRLESAGFTWEQAVAVTEGLVEAAAARSYAEGLRGGFQPSALCPAKLRKPILTFDDWLFVAAILFLSVAAHLPD